MKDWYKSLEKKHRNLLHLLAIAAILVCTIVIILVESEIALAVISVLLIAVVVLEICFIRWEQIVSKTKPVQNADVAQHHIQHTFNASDPFTEVKITDEDGSVIYRPNYYKITDSEYCLISDGGKTYHTHCNCYNNWKPEYINNFSGWQVISVEEAKRKGLTKCRFCEFNDLSLEEKAKFKAKGRQFCIVELGGYGEKEIQQNIQCAISFEHVDVEFDFEQGRYLVFYNGDILGYIKSQDVDKINSITDDVESLEAYVYDTYSDDNMSERIKILCIGDCRHSD